MHLLSLQQSKIRLTILIRITNNMAELNGLIYSFDTTIDYKNFSKEVVINNENKSGNNFSLYNVTNKNGVTFQNVPGIAWMGLEVS